MAETTAPLQAKGLQTTPLSTHSQGHHQRRDLRTLLKQLPSYSYRDTNPTRKITYTRKKEKSSQLAERLLVNGVKVVGFDLEWKPMHNAQQYNRVSLVQIASDDEVLLIQLDGSTKFPAAVKTLLESPHILKVGAGIEGDVAKLKKDWDVDIRCYLDLADYARAVDPFWNTCDVVRDSATDGALGGPWCRPTIDATDAISCTEPNTLAIENSIHDVFTSSSSLTSESLNTPPTTPPTLHERYTPPSPMTTRSEGREHVYPKGRPIGLARLVARYQGKKLDKGSQLSNWAAPLNKKQIDYAANDGCAGLDVYNTLAAVESSSEWRFAEEARCEEIITAYHLSMAAQSLPTPASSLDIEAAMAGGLDIYGRPRTTPSSSPVLTSRGTHPSSYPSPPVTPLVTRASAPMAREHKPSPSRDLSTLANANSLGSLPPPHVIVQMIPPQPVPVPAPGMGVFHQGDFIRYSPPTSYFPSAYPSAAYFNAFQGPMAPSNPYQMGNPSWNMTQPVPHGNMWVQPIQYTPGPAGTAPILSQPRPSKVELSRTSAPHAERANHSGTRPRIGAASRSESSLPVSADGWIGEHSQGQAERPKRTSLVSRSLSDLFQGKDMSPETAQAIRSAVAIKHKEEAS